MALWIYNFAFEGNRVGPLQKIQIYSILSIQCPFLTRIVMTLSWRFFNEFKPVQLSDEERYLRK